MDCKIPPETVKHLTKVLLYLTKVSDHVHLTALPSSLILTCMNASLSQFVQVKLGRDCFTAMINLSVLDPVMCASLTGNGSAFLCTVTTKSLHAAFKLKPMTEKSLSWCHIKTVVEDSQPFVLISMASKCGVTTNHKLCFQSVSDVYEMPELDIDSRWKVSPRLISFWLSQFPPHEDISIYTRLTNNEQNDDADQDDEFDMFEFGSIHFKTIPAASTADSERTCSTELQLDTMEFEVFEAVNDSALVVGMKEFKSILSLAESLGCPLESRFSKGGEPVQYMISINGMQINHIMATAVSLDMNLTFSNYPPPHSVNQMKVKHDSDSDDHEIPATPFKTNNY